jgi:hypothetical protein
MSWSLSMSSCPGRACLCVNQRRGQLDLANGLLLGWGLVSLLHVHPDTSTPATAASLQDSCQEMCWPLQACRRFVWGLCPVLLPSVLAFKPCPQAVAANMLPEGFEMSQLLHRLTGCSLCVSKHEPMSSSNQQQQAAAAAVSH